MPSLRPPSPQPATEEQVMAEDDGNAETRRRKLVEKQRLKGVGRRIATRREKTGTRQNALASRAGISRITLNRIEGGIQEPKLATLWLIADELETTARELLGEPLPFERFHPALQRALERFFLELTPVNQLLCAKEG